jgi:hypothetical protein
MLPGEERCFRVGEVALRARRNDDNVDVSALEEGSSCAALHSMRPHVRRAVELIRNAAQVETSRRGDRRRMRRVCTPPPRACYESDAKLAHCNAATLDISHRSARRVNRARSRVEESAVSRDGLVNRGNHAQRCWQRLRD